MGVVEAGKKQAAVEVDDFGVGAGELADGCVVADGEDRVAIERDCVRDRESGILGPDFAVDENDAGFVRVRCGTGKAQCQDGECDRTWFHF